MDLTQLLALIRLEGWHVAVHNDYCLDSKWYTFWLFTRGNQCVKGEAETDEAALAEVLQKIGELSITRSNTEG